MKLLLRRGSSLFNHFSKMLRSKPSFIHVYLYTLIIQENIKADGINVKNHFPSWKLRRNICAACNQFYTRTPYYRDILRLGQESLRKNSKALFSVYILGRESPHNIIIMREIYALMSNIFLINTFGMNLIKSARLKWGVCKEN